MQATAIYNPTRSESVTVAVAPAITATLFTAGTVRITLRPSDTYVRSRELLGDDVRPSYAYQITRTDNPNGGFTLFLYNLDARSNKYVYMGIVLSTGQFRLTAKSAFPKHATRVRVAEYAMPLLFAGKVADLKASGWGGEVKVVERNQPKW